MLVRIKYWLLDNLVRDICRKSDCDDCQMCMEWSSPCPKGAIFNQARRLWGDKDYKLREPKRKSQR